MLASLQCMSQPVLEEAGGQQLMVEQCLLFLKMIMHVANSTDNKTHAMHTRKHNMRRIACRTLNRHALSNVQLHTVAV